MGSTKKRQGKINPNTSLKGHKHKANAINPQSNSQVASSDTHPERSVSRTSSPAYQHIIILSNNCSKLFTEVLDILKSEQNSSSHSLTYDIVNSSAKAFNRLKNNLESRSMTLDEEFADIVFLRDLVIVNIVALANVLLKVLTRYWKEPELDQEILNNTFNHINQSRESVDLLIPNIPKETAGTDPFDLDSAINEVNLRTNSLVELSVVIGRAFKGRRNPNQAPIQIFNLTGDDPIIICKLVIKWIFPKATDTFTQEMAKSSWCKIKELHFRGNAPQEDLEHYICCFRNCERRPVGFDTFENWKYHVQQHCNSVREEECPACLKHSFEDMNSFTTHVGKHFVSIFQLIMKLALRPLPRDTVDDNHTCAVMIWNRIAPGHKCIRAKLDTGSDINMISLDLVKACDLEVKRLSQCKSQIVTWLNESKITLRYIVRLHWNSTTWRKTYSTIKFYVVKKLPYDMILGGDFVKARYPQKRVLVVHGDRRKSKEEKEREKKRHDEQKAAGEERRKEREERIKANRAGDSSNSNSNDSHSNDRQQST